MKKIVIVGGVAGGASTAARLRRLDEEAEIVMFERGEHISFANCGLPYYIGGEIREKSALTLQTPESFYATFRIDVRVWSEVTAIDRKTKTVTVANLKTGETYAESYDFLLLSPGAQPVLPNIPGIHCPRVFTLRNIADTYKIKEFIEQRKPQNALVVGGGYIGMEMAENLTLAGLSTTLVELAPQVVASVDYELACQLHNHMQQKGVRLILEQSLQSIRETEKGLQVWLNQEELWVDMVVMAIGVRPESALAKAAGLKVNEQGSIVVNKYMQTSDACIYAVGDASEMEDFVTGKKAFLPLAGPANKQGRIAADNMCGIPSKYGKTQGSAILKVFDMTVAATGINEKTAQKLGLPYAKSFTYSPNHAGYYPGAVDMLIKTLYDTNTGKILGAQIVGAAGVDKRADVFATAIRAGMTAFELTQLELCYAPPYSSAKDAVNMAGYVIENLLAEKVRNFHWHEVEALPKDGSAVLLDVRTTLEHENGHIDGCIHIPLQQLRKRWGELDKRKKIYVFCQIGLRGYIASRILSQKGFEVYNLSGGYRLYRSVLGKAGGTQGAGGGGLVASSLSSSSSSPSPAAPMPPASKITRIDACGLQCPGPILRLSKAIQEAEAGETIEISTTDSAFASDIEGYCRRTGHLFLGLQTQKGVSVAQVRKVQAQATPAPASAANGKNFIVFSGDLDKAIAAFVMANAAAALGRKVSMFFTFWGLNMLRKPGKVAVKKDFLGKMFGWMMPRGSKKLQMSKMNMGGLGAKMIRGIMKRKKVDSLEELILLAQNNGVELVACAMSMDVMGLKHEELLDGVKLGGAAAMLAHAEESDMSLFV
ncbi:MAG: DsrE/DsrF/DrsH-like family protein [Cystobacterineae bacterium]|nr:DsrE/DsrF/DrsH-like family protein [Cystobacterineae bacterium]